ncbi:hypothetical protein H4W79_000372 [Nocardiopsis terrae]|uniref:Uncharacterized protein n=1 Tax=Nocardiopsis terrae TaxID=372655 RepID=A0ABR9HAY3_9ACTN|nr:hypothetical protein [Nocardiopsis terrae]MBE1456158.1 hypothetical protein [Nocardiopsis terrae]
MTLGETQRVVIDVIESEIPLFQLMEHPRENFWREPFGNLSGLEKGFQAASHDRVPIKKIAYNPSVELAPARPFRKRQGPHRSPCPLQLLPIHSTLSPILFVLLLGAEEPEQRG